MKLEMRARKGVPWEMCSFKKEWTKLTQMDDDTSLC